MAGRAKRIVGGAGTLLAFLLLALSPAPASAGKPPERFFGVHVRSLDGGDFAQMKAANVGLLRAGFPISIARTGPERPYDWPRFDHIVSGAARNGIVLMPVLYGVPKWVPGGIGAILGPAMNGVWQDYVRALVERYGSDGEFWSDHSEIPYRPVTRWQVWNEPNSEVNWKRPNPAEYGRFLVRSARTIHGADPAAEVISAGVVAAPLNKSLQAGASYLRRMVRSRAVRRSVDAIGFHPYTKTVAQSKKLIRKARKVMDGARMDNTPIWVTEIGWGATSSPRTAPGTAARWQINPGKQRKNLRKAFEMGIGKRKRLGIEGMVWYQWKDGADPACGWCETSGLLKENDAPKRLLGTFRKVAARR
jgi:hypothetical protein